ncbi:flavodoxin family protein [Clostridium botulinum]|uniref:flavodoxin family protein n=1 Tax=Clostridium botulinum TaxID=1491 RepID=UPI00099C4B06|nr:flavodoxin family protein [Clostridium botulinum]NFK37306.1 flavodoxin family protein [Clostridium botulinum H04402 065]MCJ8171348.1 flavodoxin family protein [Clostridium botulinum]NFB17939.1 flavodoxin family protein [Clostridium botulinum]NFB68045.1 flavodoxin family protein [Clostridium botulinum]NFB98892.1 flavodoxin family protein [Clostridium botulinum]
MNILSVLASPRNQGNTAILLKEYLKGVEGLTSQVEIETIYLQAKNIQYCTGCNACKKSSQNQCVLKDDMQDIYKSVEKADVLVLATPVYVFNMAAQLKTFLDRLYAVDYNTLLNKKIVLLTTYGDSSEANSGVKNIVQSITMLSQYLGMELIQNLNVSTYKIQVSENEQSKKAAYTLGANIFKY